MTLRDKRQLEFAQDWLKHRFGILYLCPRFGKIFTTINILEELPEGIKILIAYPDKEIKKSWEDDFKKRGYKNPNITYTTFLSMHKYVDEIYDLVIFDEIHLLSDNQLIVARELLMFNREVLGLTGTLREESEEKLLHELGIRVLSYYPIEQAIEEGVVTDYQITVIRVPLDNKKTGMFKNPRRTEKKQFDALSWVIKDKQYNGEDTMFLRLARMRIIQGSEAKRLATVEFLKKNKDDRILVFCGKIDIADNLGIPSFHSKSKGSKEILQNFAEGYGKQLAVIKIGNAGITYKPLNKVLINYFDSNGENMAQRINRCMGMEYDTPDKKAQIFIICSTEPTEAKWLKKALEFFEDDKIKYI